MKEETRQIIQLRPRSPLRKTFTKRLIQYIISVQGDNYV